MPSFLNALLKNPNQGWRLENQRSGRIVAARVMTAFDSASRRVGLLRHDAMPEGAALIIAPCNAIHTIRMQFDIDVAFTAKDGKVVKIRHSIPPWRMAAALRAFAAIEFAAGTLSDADTRSGDTLVLVST